MPVPTPRALLSLDGSVQPTSSSLHESHMSPLPPSQSSGTQAQRHSPEKKGKVKGRTRRSESVGDDVSQHSMQGRQEQSQAMRQRAHFLPAASGAPAVPAVPRPGSSRSSRSSPGEEGPRQERARRGGRGTARGPGQAGGH